MLLALCHTGVKADVAIAPQEISVAGLFPIADGGRITYDFNPGWRYLKGDIANGADPALDDAAWEVVATPHSVELTPAEGSGCRNYQGPVWYRKRFILPAETAGKNVQLYFEAVMGKQTYYINGTKVAENFGGYLPVALSLTDAGVKPGQECVVAVRADNSDDKNYPPGKSQHSLDFAYHGGIYRDVWMIAKSPVALSEAVNAGKVAGGGVFVHFDKISAKSAEVNVDTDLRNSSANAETVTLETSIIDPAGKTVARASKRVSLAAGTSSQVKQTLAVKSPKLWTPDAPTLYRVETRIKKGKLTLDGGATRIGIRSVEFDRARGLVINGQPFGKIIGANRHQDFAYVGNALPNSQQWRDAKRLRDAGCRVIRAAHYPQDPSFMDACDELGLFVIVATPGWQFWNKDPKFEEMVHDNTRRIIRRDRNHPSVLMWEPILNETRFPATFAEQAYKVTCEEYPYPGRPAAAADMNSAGVKKLYDIVYGWPGDEAPEKEVKQCVFTREWGENVDDWYAHNCNNRASRSWGEKPMSVQALSLADTYDKLFASGPGFIGGCQWHPFDHQRGYHPDPYWGGIFDAFRQPKSAYWMFRSQSPATYSHPMVESGPMVKIMHEMTPFSDPDVVVFSNCDSVRLSLYNGARSITLPVVHGNGHMPSVPVKFDKQFDFWEARNQSYVKKNWQGVKMVADGIIGGKVVATDTVMPSRRSTKVRLTADWCGKPLVADGSDFIVVVAEITDDLGHVRRLAKENIVFTVEGEGTLIGDASIHANPRPVEWGSAPALIRSTSTPGKIRITARVEHGGTHAPAPAELVIESVPSSMTAIQGAAATLSATRAATRTAVNGSKLTDEEKRRILEEVDIQQKEFGIQK